MTVADLDSVIEQLRIIADRTRRGSGDGAPSVPTVLGELAPVGTTLYVSRAQDGRWWFYLTMPASWRPPAEGGRWIYNEGRGYYWDTGPAPTKRGALVAGVRRLLDVLEGT